MKTILITGASPKGIGEACTKIFASKNWKVIATLRDPSKNQELSKLKNVQIIKLDITKTEEMKNIIHNLQKDNNINVLLNNAGYGMKCPLELSEEEDTLKLYQTNVFGTLNLIRLFIPYFKQKKEGTIITISSTSGIIGMPLDGIYGSSKRSLTAMNESLYYELKQYNIKVKVIFPGITDTNFLMTPYIEGEYEHIQENQYQFELGGESDMIGPEECSKNVYNAVTDNKDKLFYYGDHISQKLIENYRKMGIENFKEYFYELLFKNKSSIDANDKDNKINKFNYKNIAQEIGWNFSRINPIIEKDHNFEYYEIIKNNINSNNIVLDIGCGSGEKSIHILKIAHKIYALDNEEEMLKKYKENLNSLTEKNKFELILGDSLKALKFQNEFFDVIVSRHCGGKMDEIYRVLKKGGLFISEDVSKYDCQELKEIFHRGQEYFTEPLYKKTMNEIMNLNYSSIKFDKYEEIEYYPNKDDFIFLLSHTPILNSFDINNIEDCKMLDEYIKKYKSEKGIKLIRRLYMFYLQK